MIKRVALFLLVSLSVQILSAQTKLLTRGMRITTSARIKKAVYNLDGWTDTSRHVIEIKGNNIVIDFGGAEIKGSASKTRPDEFFGIAISISNSKNVTIKNLKARGYKVALLARNVDGLTLENCDFSYNYRQHLNSNQEREDLADWMSYHKNDNDEWLRYGAAIYLSGCDSSTIRNCTVTGGQNALMMRNCNGGLIYNNNFSYNSGIGIGMYQCSDNKVCFNKVNFNVRGYSHGVYNRGQDSAGILVYEQSSRNIFYRNSVTHSGDGFFLWAGQTTMDSGNGGCNDNVLVKNDFSYAPTNGVEVTFSRNRITGNRIFECDNGIWAGYSYDTRINDNQFRNNNVGIAIEHGLRNSIDYNIFYGEKTAVKLWSRATQPADWGYAKYRDTRSAGYLIAMNSFNMSGVAMDIKRTDSLNVFGNTYSETKEIFKADSTVTNLDSFYTELVESPEDFPVVKDAMDPFKGGGVVAGRKNIRMLEWGPYDFRSPVIWNTNPVDSTGLMQFDLLGPKGSWVVKKMRGVKNLSATKGVFPATLSAERIGGKDVDVFIELEYVGERIVTPLGKVVPAATKSTFRFRKYFKSLDWEVLFFSMDTSYYNPVRTGQLFSPNVRMAPIKTEKVSRLSYAWWGGLKVDRMYPQFITVANGKGNFKAGNYELSVTWDDAVRVYVGEKLVLNEWTPSKYKFDESPNRRVRVYLSGLQDIRVEHLELGGFATLGLEIRPVE